VDLAKIILEKQGPNVLAINQFRDKMNTFFVAVSFQGRNKPCTSGIKPMGI
jgi:formyltetrahydrofolate hydrolase